MINNSTVTFTEELINYLKILKCLKISKVGKNKAAKIPEKTRIKSITGYHLARMWRIVARGCAQGMAY